MTRPLTLHAHEVRRLQAAGSVTLWRPVKPQPEAFIANDVLGQPQWYLDGDSFQMMTCPHGAPGTVAWVREVWRIIPQRSDYVLEYAADPQLQRRSVHPDTADKASMTGKWRSPVTMPRWASRLSVVVQAVTCKLVGELSDAEICECLEAPATWPGPGIEPYPRQLNRAMQVEWDARYGKQYPYAANPWAWAVAVTLESQTDKFRGQGGMATRLGWPP